MRGSLRQRSPGSWSLRYDAGRRKDGHRRQVRETIHGTRRDAERVLAQRLHEVDTHGFRDPGKMLFGALADAFLQARKTVVAPTTYDVYSRHLAIHIRPVLANVAIAALRPQHVESLLAATYDHSRTRQMGEPLAPGTLRNILVTLRACLQYGVRNGWLHHNVAVAVQAPSNDTQREPVLFTAQRLIALFEAIAGTEIEMEAAFAIATGTRRGEICGFRWGDIDLNGGWYTVRRNAVHVGNRIEYRSPKSKKSRRTDALPKALRKLLSGHRHIQQQRMQLLGLGDISDDTPLFTRADGLPWKPNELSHQFSRLVRREGLAPLRFHDLRHGHASLAFAAGVPLRTISEALGHSSIGIIANIYVHLLIEAKKEKADKVDRYLADALTKHAAKSTSKSTFKD